MAMFPFITDEEARSGLFAIAGSLIADVRALRDDDVLEECLKKAPPGTVRWYFLQSMGEPMIFGDKPGYLDSIQITFYKRALAIAL